MTFDEWWSTKEAVDACDAFNLGPAAFAAGRAAGVLACETHLVDTFEFDAATMLSHMPGYPIDAFLPVAEAE